MTARRKLVSSLGRLGVLLVDLKFKYLLLIWDDLICSTEISGRRNMCVNTILNSLGYVVKSKLN